ncbi:CocE/NonD family hydrolase [Porticoccaceae bacterium]|nr:CocE/NonD family hydrolase [Porticoccaceae bacterium]
MSIGLNLFLVSVILSGTTTSIEASVPGSAKNPIHKISSLADLAGGAEHFMLPMRDKISLWTSVYYPQKMGDSAPVILVRTPYQFDTEGAALRPFLENGYIIVLQNERGRYWSEGKYHTLPNAGRDGYDTMDWIIQQDWSNKKVGTYGCSSSGDTQTELLTHRHPAHAAAINAASGSSIGEIGPFNEQGLFYRGGAVQMAWILWYLGADWQKGFAKFPKNISRNNRDLLAQQAVERKRKATSSDLMGSMVTAMSDLPLDGVIGRNGGQDRSDFDKYISRTPNDPAWKSMSYLQAGDKTSTPTLWLFQTHDIGVGPNLAGFEYLLENSTTLDVRRHQRMIMSPLGHCSYGSETEDTQDGDRSIGDARFAYEDTFLNWFDHWLKKEGPDIESMPLAQVYLPGKNSWVSFDSWPAAEDQYRKSLYLKSVESAASRLGDGKLESSLSIKSGLDKFVFDPNYPVPTIGGDGLGLDVNGSTMQSGSFDQSAIELRNDVLVYTSAPIDKALDIIGFAEVELYVSSDAPDTDFTANLVNVTPDGKAYILGGSIQRARWRDGYNEKKLMKAGEVYKLRIGPFFVSNRFKKGHRIRLDISSSSFPRYERNLNTGGDNYNETDGRIAENSILHGGRYPSKINLPVVNLKP